MQNVIAIFSMWRLFILVLAYDVWKALWFVDPATGKARSASASVHWIAINVYLLGGYTSDATPFDI